MMTMLNCRAFLIMSCVVGPSSALSANSTQGVAAQVEIDSQVLKAVHHIVVSSADTKRGQPGLNLRSTWGQHGVNLGSTWGQPGFNLGQHGVTLGSTRQSDKISHIDMGDDHIDTVISHIISLISHIDIQDDHIDVVDNHIDKPYPKSIFHIPYR